MNSLVLTFLWRPDSRFLNLCFVCWRMNLFFAVFSVLNNCKTLISPVIYFSYFSFFISFVYEGLRDGEIPCPGQRLDGLDDFSLSWMFLLMCLDLVFVKLGLFSGIQAVTSVFEGCTQFSLSSLKSAAFAAVLHCVF